MMDKDKSFKLSLISIIYIWLLVFAILPLLFMLIFTFLQHNNTHLYLWRFTLNNYRHLFSWIYLRVFWHCDVATLIRTENLQ